MLTKGKKRKLWKFSFWVTRAERDGHVKQNLRSLIGQLIKKFVRWYQFTLLSGMFRLIDYTWRHYTQYIVIHTAYMLTRECSLMFKTFVGWGVYKKSFRNSGGVGIYFSLQKGNSREVCGGGGGGGGGLSDTELSPLAPGGRNICHNFLAVSQSNGRAPLRK